MFRNILVPQDGSSHSNSSLAYAIFLSKKFKAVLIGQYVVDTVAFEGPFLHDLSGALGFEPYLNFSSKMRDVLEQKGKEILENFKEACKMAGIESDTILDSGIVSNRICEESKIADIIVMGRRGINVSFEHGLLGSTTEGVIRKAPKPVMIVSDKYEEIRKPLLVYNGSFSSSRVMRTAAEFAKVLALPLTVLIVSRGKNEGLLNEAEEYFKPYELEVKYVTLENKVPADIVTYIDSEFHDLVFLGASGHGKLVERVLGGTTEFVLRNLEKPIILER